MGDGCYSFELIDVNGVYNVSGMENFIKTVKLGECGLSYVVVSIMGPQSSGKSTLLNHLFHTNFKEMDASKGRSQTTKGIWLARCMDIEPCTIIMDLEGSDGSERGEDDTASEKQSAVFALTVSDIVLINMWCHDIGREQAASKPLLSIVFQSMMQLFSPRKTTLLIVIRDKTKTSLEMLEPILREDLQKIWDSIKKPLEHKNAPLSEFINVEVVALSSFEEKEEQFKEQVANLRQRFFHSIAPNGLAGDRRGIIPASRFSFSAQQIWKVIKENKDFDLPSFKVIASAFRCEEIANMKIASFSNDEEWRHIVEVVQNGIVPGFGKKVSTILENYLISYDTEAKYFDDSVRTSKRWQLESKLLQFVQPAYHSMLGHLRAKTLEDFKARFENVLKSGKGFMAAAIDCTRSLLSTFNEGYKDAVIEQASWDSSEVFENLQRDFDAHVTLIRSTKLSELTSLYEKNLNKALFEPVRAFLDAADDSAWPGIRNLLQRETNNALSDFSIALALFDLDQTTIGILLAKLEEYGRSIIESWVREEASRVLMRMNGRFLTVFRRLSGSKPRFCTKENLIKINTKKAHLSSLKLLSVIAIIRFGGEEDNVENTLRLALMDVPNFSVESIQSLDPLASITWEDVPPTRTIITPFQCKLLWWQFKEETEFFIKQGITNQEANWNNWMFPPWAIATLLILGYFIFITRRR